jgi:hypothetical protein
MTKKEESSLFVGITSGDDIRRNLLGCSKSILEALKDYEHIKSVREERQNVVHQFKNDVKCISRLINKLKSHLPKVKDAGIKKKTTKKKVEITKVSAPIHIEEPKPKAKTELERLEDELSSIENKLNGLA